MLHFLLLFKFITNSRSLVNSSLISSTFVGIFGIATVTAISCFTIYNFFLTEMFSFETSFKCTKTSFSDLVLMGFWIFNFGQKQQVLPTITSYKQINSTLKDSLLNNTNLENESLTEKARVLSILNKGLKTEYQSIQNELEQTKNLIETNKNFLSFHQRGSPNYLVYKNNQKNLKKLKSDWVSDGKKVSKEYNMSNERMKEVNAEILRDLTSFSLEKSLKNLINGLDSSFTKILGDGHLKEIFFSGFLAVIFVAFVIITKESIMFLYHFNETSFYKGFCEFWQEIWRFIKTLFSFYTPEDLSSSSSTGQYHVQNDPKPVARQVETPNTEQIANTKKEGFNWTFWGVVTVGATVAIYGIRYILKK